MTTKKKIQPAKPAAKRAPKTKITAAKAKTTSAKKPKAVAKAAFAPVKKRAPAAKKTVAKSKAPAAKTKKRAAKAEVAPEVRIGEPVLDAIGDVSDAEAETYLGEAEAAAEAEPEGAGAEESGPSTRAEVEADAGPETPAKLERLQKILSQAGIASRRRAEEMIAAGRVQVNGQVVTQLGTKADAGRDHIRVDGKLLHGAERHRYFMLNKPRGTVTTVTDPEGRPTVMQFFAKMHERLYPVGRLDYLSEGLLLMTNDGELANLLSKAGSGVEKTYLVKVAGQPSEEELERLRGGVAIEKGEPGSEPVRTAPARIQQVRVGDNPWFEVVLTEGRNRELRKMFAAVGHFAEKIRRVGYGPLVLDVEPGKMRELELDEVNALRLTAEGKIKLRRLPVDRMLPREAGVKAEKRGKFREKRDRGAGPQSRAVGQRRDWTPQKKFEPGSGPGRKPFGQREDRAPRTDFRPRDAEFRPRREGGAVRSGERPSFDKRRGKPFGARPEFGGRREGGEFKGGGPRVGGKPGFGRRQEKPFGAARPRFDKPGFDKLGFEKRNFDRPRFEKPAGEPAAGPAGGFAERPKFEGRKPFTGGKRPFGGGRPSPGPKGGGDRPRSGRPPFEKRNSDRPRFEKPGFSGRPGGPAEGRREDAPRKPFRPQGDRPSFKPGGAGRPKPGFGARPGGFGKPNRPGGR
ncbi:MAG: pseudouridine synthase [Terracidiphilus sp.]